MTTLTTIQAQIDAIPRVLRAAVERHERDIAGLYDAKRRQLHGDTIHAEKVTAANQTLFAALDRLTNETAETARTLQKAQDSADPLLAILSSWRVSRRCGRFWRLRRRRSTPTNWNAAFVARWQPVTTP